MARHAFKINFSVEMRIGGFKAWWQIPLLFLGIEGKGCLKQIAVFFPQMAVGMVSAANNITDELTYFVQGICTL